MYNVNVIEKNKERKERERKKEEKINRHLLKIRHIKSKYQIILMVKKRKKKKKVKDKFEKKTQ
jgi:hypothetical protein